LQPAHLEQIGEIAVEGDRDLQRERPVTVVAHSKALIGRALPEEDRARDVQQIFLQHDLRATGVVIVRIGEVDREQRVVIAHVRAKQQRLPAIEAQFEMREKARVGMIEPVRAARGRADIAEAVGDDEGVAMLERAARARRGRGGENGKLVFRRSRDLVGFDLQRGLSEHRQTFKLRRIDGGVLSAEYQRADDKSANAANAPWVRTRT